MKTFKIAACLFILFVSIAFGAVFWGRDKSNAKDMSPAGSEGPTQMVVAPVVIAPDSVPVKESPVKIIAFGDLLLDRYIKLYIDRNGADYPLKNVKDAVADNDLVLANLEGSFTDFKPRRLDPNNTSFTFDPKLVSMLRDNKFNIFNLANNHVQDFGREGFKQSQAYLDNAGIAHFGDYYNGEESLLKDINGAKIAFAAYNEFGDASIDATVDKIKKIRPQADYVIIYTHWGVEYQTKFSSDQQAKARRLIDAGADVVLGSHPHVIQPVEIYKNKPIFYSLGNFLFDQIFSFEVRHGLGVKLAIDKDRVAFDLYPTEMNKFQASLADAQTKTAILEKIAAGSVCDAATKEGVAKGQFILER